MKIVAFKMKLKPAQEKEYKRRHDLLWPELSSLLKDAGISEYSIFLDEETLTLFAIQKVSSDNRVAALSSSPIMKKWWEYMADIMDTNSDYSPVVVPLKSIFYLP